MTSALRLAAIIALLGGSGSAAAQVRPADPRPVEAMTVRDFAAKWLMQQGDLAEIERYRGANAALRAQPRQGERIVLFGDSITFHWEAAALPPVSGVQWVNRGIPGQNSSQMLLRFEADAVALDPAMVVLLAGTNDARVYAGDPAPASAAILGRLEPNVTAMADIADARRIRLVIAAIPPVAANRPDLARDPATIRAANHWLRDFAAARG